jgi:hypothetical protein
VKELTNILGEVIEVKEFEIWWNPYCATVINHSDNFYQVFLIIYESAHDNINENLKVFPKTNSTFRWGRTRGIAREKHGSLTNAQNEAQRLRNELIQEKGEYWKTELEARIELPLNQDCKIM